MLANRNAMATIAVKNLDAAQKFYESTLGLTLLPGKEKGVLNFQSGTTNLVVYQSAYAGTNKATSATWSVSEEFDSIVKTLKQKGVVFEHYDLPGLTLQGDVHVAGDFKGVWFKDPDGNILHVLNE